MTKLADAQIAEYLTREQYHPRSSKHGDVLCRFLLQDLLETCEPFRHAAERDAIVFHANWTIDPLSMDRWNADLVIGPPTQPPDPGAPRVGPIAQGEPKDTWLAIDAKTIMTEHGKARRNRQRDLNSFHDILHRKNPRSIVGGIVIVNMAERFHTPLARSVEGPTVHKNIVRLVTEIVTQMGAIPKSGPVAGEPGLEALGLIVVSHTNIPGELTELVVAPPAPPPNGPLSYSAFLRDLCVAFTIRYAG
jgi:hypothetical protein